MCRMTHNVSNVMTITGGPCKTDFVVDRLVELHFEGYEPIIRRNAMCHVSFVEKEDGSGESFNFEGTLFDKARTGHKVRGCYNTKRRKGTFHFV